MPWKTAPPTDPKKLADEARHNAREIERGLPVNADTNGVIDSLNKLASDLEGN